MKTKEVKREEAEKRQVYYDKMSKESKLARIDNRRGNSKKEKAKIERKMQHKNDKQYTVWVGGGEVNDYLLTKEEAQKIADSFINDGYEDVRIEKITLI